jgi:hypothetical protein
MDISSQFSTFQVASFEAKGYRVSKIKHFETCEPSAARVAE